MKQHMKPLTKNYLLRETTYTCQLNRQHRRLTIFDLRETLPFVPVLFSLHNVPSSRVRGEHAHRVCQQYLVALNGSLKVVLDNGKSRETYELNSPTFGLYMGPMIWASQYDFSLDCVLGVFASSHYDPRDYIRNYEEFLGDLT
jgi:hypothetical protein